MVVNPICISMFKVSLLIYFVVVGVGAMVVMFGPVVPIDVPQVDELDHLLLVHEDDA